MRSSWISHYYFIKIKYEYRPRGNVSPWIPKSVCFLNNTWRQICSSRYAYACLLSRVRLLVIPWTVARQAPLSVGFSRQESWGGLPFPPPGDPPNPGMEPPSLWSPALAEGVFSTVPPGKPCSLRQTKSKQARGGHNILFLTLFLGYKLNLRKKIISSTFVMCQMFKSYFYIKSNLMYSQMCFRRE